MRILQINKFYYLKGGSEAYLFELEKEINRLGHPLIQFSMKHKKNRASRWAEYFVDNIDYDRAGLFDKINSGIKIIYSYEAKKKIRLLIEKSKPNIAHLHLFQHQLSPSILAELKKRDIPIIYTAHDLKSICPNYKMYTQGKICERCKGHKYYNCFIHKCTKDSYLKSLINTFEMYVHTLLRYYNLIDLIITPSDFYRKKLIEFRFPRRKVIHIPNFVDLDLLKPSYNHKGYFIYFGRLSGEKGLLTLLEAMRRIKKGKLVLAGTGPMKEPLEERVKALGLNNIKMVGFQSGRALSSLIQNSICSVLPSRWYENGPMSVLESFAHGKPVIGSNIGGIPEHINHGEDGMVFEPGNVEDLVEKLNILLCNYRQAAEMGRNARKKAEKLYSKKLHSKKLLEIYKQYAS